MSDTKKKKKKKKKDKILTIVQIIWIITHNSQRITLLNASMIKGKYKAKEKRSKWKDESRLISKETRMPFKLYPEKNNIFTKFSG